MKESLALKLKDLEIHERACRNNMSDLKKKILDYESELISLKIEKDNILEQLLLIEEGIDIDEPSAREVDIERFKKILPNLLK